MNYKEKYKEELDKRKAVEEELKRIYVWIFKIKNVIGELDKNG